MLCIFMQQLDTTTFYVILFTMSEIKRVQLILTKDMNSALEDVARKRAANKSALVRLVLAEWLESQHNISVEHSLQWGGVRSSS